LQQRRERVTRVPGGLRWRHRELLDGAPDLEFRLATDALELEEPGLSYQRVSPTNR
jgi:hypothetical protein